MSGHGVVERRLLVILANGSRRFNTFELAGKAFEVPTTQRASRRWSRPAEHCATYGAKGWSAADSTAL